MCATAGGGDVSWPREDRCFIDGVSETFNTQLDKVGSMYGHVSWLGQVSGVE